MAVEIERKFLVINEDWRTNQGTLYRQGYLNRDKTRTVRVRIAGSKAFLTIKGISTGASRAEFEYEIPLADVEALMLICDGPLVEKTRHLVEHGGMTWEVDEFHGENGGLILAEIELQRADQQFEKPSWLGREVTDDARYYNSNLATQPYSSWTKIMPAK